MTPQDHKVKITDSIVAILAIFLIAYCAHLLHDYQCKALQHKEYELKIIQVPETDLYDTIHIDNLTLNTQN